MKHARRNLRLSLLSCCIVALGVARPVHSVPPTDADVDALVEQLVERLRRAQVTDGAGRGSFEGEMGGVHGGGVSALATYALLSAGLAWHDPTIEQAVDYLAEHPLPGTYSRSLRAAVWAMLAQRTTDDRLRLRYRKLLQNDTEWLVRALRSDGFYGYDAEGTGGDHSCSQFGVLGVWAAESAAAEVPDSYWEKVTRHWLTYQEDDGSWSYSGSPGGTATMTTAGANTMYITLAQHFIRAETPYARLRGVTSRGRAAADVDRALTAAERGLAWLSERDIFAGGPYQLFGLERLGVASGRKFVGSIDWYRSGVERIGPIGAMTVDDAFRLLFLTYGRAPVLINKLQYGGGQDWNEYYRDLHFLTSYLSAQHERIYKWQIVSADSPLHDLLDAPLLLISGGDRPVFSPSQKRRLREYVVAGGTILGHADRASERFSRGFRELIDQLLGDRGTPLAPLSAAHPLFAAVHRDEGGKWASELRVEGAGNGLRTWAYLFPADIAGAWHQDQSRKHADLFNLMINLRACAAPEYGNLPKRLRPPEGAGTPAPPRGYLVVERACWSETPVHAGGAWEALGRKLAFEHGLSLVTVDRAGAAAKVAPVDLLHAFGTQRFSLSEQDIGGLVEMLRGGGMLWMEACGRGTAFAESASALMKDLAARAGGTVTDLPPEHPLLTGEMPGGRRIGPMTPNRWARELLPPGVPRVQVLLIGDRPAALVTPFDVLATGSGQFLYDVPAYGPPETAALLSNLVLWRYDRVSDDPRSVFIREIVRKRSVERLRSAVPAMIESADWGPACQAVAALARLEPDAAETRNASAALQTRLTREAADAQARSQTAQAARLAMLVDEFFPGAASTPAPGGESTLEAKASVAPAAPAVRLPAELASIVIVTAEGTTDARILLGKWFDLDGQREQQVRRLRERLSDLKDLDHKAEDLIARQGGRGGRGERGGAEFERIAAERKAIEEDIRNLRAGILQIEHALSALDESLLPHAAAMASLGVQREKDRWVVAEAP